MHLSKDSKETELPLPHDIDFNYIFSHCYHSNYKIPDYYDKETWKSGETYRMRISNIYDPSKFWIVLKERELDIFQNFLTSFYTKYGSYYKMRINTASKDMYCAVWTENAFFRGLIVNIPNSLVLERKAAVFLFDFGYMSMINLKDLYYLSEKFYDIPRFSVRASLSYVQPYDNCAWNYNVVKRFSELVTNKVLLCILECTDPKRKIVEITIGSVNEFSRITDVGNTLINENLAKCLINKKELAMTGMGKNSRYSSKTKYPYLFPSFESIEGGMVPSTVYTSEMLMQCVARDVLFKPYYTYKGTSEK